MKLKELRKKLAILSLTTSLLFNTGCLNLENSNNTTTEDNTTEIEEQASTELSEEELKELQLQEYKDFFNNFEINYKIEDYLITDEEIDQIIKNSKTKKECDFKWDKSAISLTDLIINNSHEYVKNHSKYKDCFKYDNESSHYISNALYMAIESLKDSTNNTDEDACRMQTLKVVVDNTIDDYCFGTYDDDENLIAISIDNIKSYAEEEKIDWQRKLYTVVYHEINHVRQESCYCRLEKGDPVSSISYQDRFFN